MAGHDSCHRHGNREEDQAEIPKKVIDMSRCHDILIVDPSKGLIQARERQVFGSHDTYHRTADRAGADGP